MRALAALLALLLLASPAHGAREMGGTSSDEINAGSSVPNLTADWTISGWFWRQSNTRTGNTNTDALWSRWTDSGTHRQLYLYIARNDVGNSNAINVDIPFVAGSINVYCCPSIQTWHHFALTRGSNTWTLYVDGAQVDQDTNSSTQETGGSVYIGGTASTVGAAAEGHFLGKLAEFACWDDDLTAAEVLSLGRGLHPVRVRPASLQGYWPLVGRASPEPDLIANNNGTLTGTSAATTHPPMLGW